MNQITALAARFLPHITNMLPFITDQILMHFYTNDLFLGTQIEKLNRLFHGKMDCSGYGKPMRYKLRDKVGVTEKELKEIYKEIETINDGHDYESLELPAVVFYTNIKSKLINDDEWERKDKKKRSWDDILVYEKKIITKEGEKFFKFIDLVEDEENPYKYQNTSRGVFPAKPNELDVKNLLYIWVSDFVVSDGDSNRNNGVKSRKEWKNYIKEEIRGVWLGDEFENKFVDLDDIKKVKMHE